jgi:hypothetical protein
MKKWNHYTCPDCGGVTIALHENEGVTPFTIRCRVKDETTPRARVEGCSGMAESNFFTGPQNDDQTPHVIFFRPEPMKAIEFINTQPEKDRPWLLEHYEKGGSLMRLPAPATA